MGSKAIILSLFLIFFSLFVHQGVSIFADGVLGVGQLVEEGKCVNKIRPCVPYMKAGGLITPDRTCCDNVIMMVTNETECYCKFYENDKLRRAMHLSEDDVARLPKDCGALVDHSRCYSGGSLATAPVSSRSSGKMITPYTIIIHIGVPVSIALLIALLFSTP